MNLLSVDGTFWGYHSYIRYQYIFIYLGIRYVSLRRVHIRDSGETDFAVPAVRISPVDGLDAQRFMAWSPPNCHSSYKCYTSVPLYT